MIVQKRVKRCTMESIQNVTIKLQKQMKLS